MYPSSDIDQFLAHPVKGASAVFAILFIISCGLHVYQNQRYKCWAYTWPLPFACILITAGFICREVTSHGHYEDELASAVQGLFYSSTPIFTLPLYLLLLRLLSLPTSLIRVRHWYFFFITNCLLTAVITLTAQGAATYFSPAQPLDAIRAGLALIKASLLLQLILNAGFIAILTIYHYRQSVRDVPQSEHRGPDSRKMMIVASTFYVLIGLIVVRNIYRTVQIFEPPLAGIWMEEVYFWVFEACLMLAWTVVFHVLHPAKFMLTEERCVSE